MRMFAGRQDQPVIDDPSLATNYTPLVQAQESSGVASGKRFISAILLERIEGREKELTSYIFYHVLERQNWPIDPNDLDRPHNGSQAEFQMRRGRSRYALCWNFLFMQAGENAVALLAQRLDLADQR